MANPGDRYFSGIREKYTKDEIKHATAWVERTFEKYVETVGNGAQARSSVYVHRMVVTPYEIENHLTTRSEGWYEAQHVESDKIAMFYIHIILDDTIPEEDKSLAIAEYDEGAGHGYGPYFRNYPDLPFYVLPWDEINRRKKHYEDEYKKRAVHERIIVDPLTSDEAKREARQALGIP